MTSEARVPAPTFWRYALLGLVIGVAVGSLTRAHSGPAPSPTTGARVETAALFYGMFLFQLTYLVGCHVALHGSAKDGRAWAVLRGMLSFGTWVLAFAGAMIALVVRGPGSLNLEAFVIIATVSGLFVLYVSCRGLRLWSEQPESRKDIGAFLVQSGVTLLLLWLGFAALETCSLFGLDVPEVGSDLLNTLLYGSTLLLVPPGWSLLHSLRPDPVEIISPGTTDE